MLKDTLKKVLGARYSSFTFLFRKTGTKFTFLFRKTGTKAFCWVVDVARSLNLLPQLASSGEGESFLIISLTPHLGDTIMLVPMLERLRRAHPKATIECVVEETVAPFFKIISGIDRVYELNLGKTVPTTLWLTLQRTWLIARGYWTRMRNCKPAVCIVPRWHDDIFRDRVLAYLIGAERRVGFASTVLKSARPAPYRDKLLTEAYEGGHGFHEPQRFCLLLTLADLIPQTDEGSACVTPLKSLRTVTSSTDWIKLAARLGIDRAKPFAIIAPGASRAAKRWPIERWKPIIRRLKERDLVVVLLSGGGDATVAQELYSSINGGVVLVAGTTTFVESVALISQAALFLGNDSGP